MWHHLDLLGSTPLASALLALHAQKTTTVEEPRLAKNAEQGLDWIGQNWIVWIALLDSIGWLDLIGLG